MRTLYYRDSTGNFGDDLNEWLWETAWPEKPREESDDNLVLVGIGTIFGLHPPPAHAEKIVIGTGVGYDPIPPLDDKWHILAVRGPLSARALGIDPALAQTDGAALLRALPQFGKPAGERTGGIVFMPHLSARLGKWEAACKRAGIEFLNPQWDSHLLLSRIEQADLVLADAMHAAICADALRVPWVPCVTSAEISTFKWTDWSSSVGLPYRPNFLPFSSVLEYLRDRIVRRFGKPHCVEEQVLAEIGDDRARLQQVLLDSFTQRFSPEHRQTERQKRQYKRAMNVIKFLRKSRLELLWSPIDAIMVARAAKALKALTNRPRYLSEDKDLDRAVAGLKDALRRASDLARRLTHG
ncbi:MAG: hypothetical protein PGN12_13530 [Sphingomonas phyllosphaerae]